MLTLAAASIGDWSPTILVSRDVTDGPRVAQFIERARSGYVAPEILFSEPEAVTVAGRRFAVFARDRGLVTDSIHTLGRHEWHELFFGINRSSLHPKSDAVPLIVGNSGYNSYYHWTLESVGATLVRRLLDGPVGPLVVPPLTERWQSDLQHMFAFDEPLIEVAPDELAAFDEAVLTNLTGRSYAFGPHPALLQEFVRQRSPASTPDTPRRIYISRFDVPGRRRMENEESLCDLLRTHGFAIIGTSSLSVAEQAALFYAADLIVAPHGAGLTNLVYARDGALGPKVIELIQKGYPARGFLKIAQAKQLDYRAIVNPNATTVAYHHHGTWRCDLDLVEKALAAL